MEWGNALAAIQRAAGAGSQQAQQRLDSKPELLAGLSFYWQAFNELNTCRSVGMGAGPIPWTAIDSYAARHRINSADDFNELVIYMTAMDAAYLEHQNKEAKHD